MVQVKTKTKVDKTQLEAEFKALVDSVGIEIEQKLQQAKLLVKQACKLSAEHGIPFYSPVSILGENFVPPSFKQKFNALNKEDIAELTGVPAEELEQERYSEGWNHSSVC
jgi:hypothetical protein